MNPRLSALTLLVVASAGCKGAQEGDAEPAAMVEARTVIVSSQAFTESFGVIGNVVSRAGHAASLSAQAPARVARVLVAAGDAVQSGQPLIELDPAPFQATLQAARAAYTAAERANERQQRLAGEGIVPRKDADAATADLERTRAEVLAAERAVHLATLRAPISGVVTRMTATLGASVDPSQPLIEIADPRALDILMNATPMDAARVRRGAKVALHAGAIADGEPVGVGTVVDIAAAVDSVTRSVPVRVQTDMLRRPIRIGETIFGAIALAVRPDAIVIPNDALVPDGEHFKVFVVDASGTAHEREVKVGGRSETGAEITEGLHAGERIVTQGAYGVTDSAKVQLLPTANGDSVKRETKVKP